MIRFACHKCMTVHEVEAGLAGAEIYCRTCNASMRVPMPSLVPRRTSRGEVLDGIEVVEERASRPPIRHQVPFQPVQPIKIDIQQSNVSSNGGSGHFQYGCGMLLVVFGAMAALSYLSYLDDVDQWGRRLMGRYLAGTVMCVVMIGIGFCMMILARRR